MTDRARRQRGGANRGDEPIDFSPLASDDAGLRAERVARHVMAAVTTRNAPRPDLAGAIVAVGPAALAAAALVALVIRLGPGSAAEQSVRPPTVGAALGVPPAAERVIRSPEPATGWELLTAFQDDR
jgi:hypothetical protein